MPTETNADSFSFIEQTTVRQIVTTFQAFARRRAALVVELLDHPTATNDQILATKGRAAQISDSWDKWREMVQKVTGVTLKPWGQLAGPGLPEVRRGDGGPDPLRINLKTFKAEYHKMKQRDAIQAATDH